MVAAVGTPLAACVACPALGATAPTSLTLQLSWAAGVPQAGEVVAKHLGYYEQEGIALTIRPGGPSNDGVAVVASGHADIGQIASSPSLVLAVSEGLPIRCFAAGAQRHPFTFFSLPANPVRRPADLKGKRVGLAPGAKVLLRALLARHGMSEKDVKVIPTGIGAQLLLTGQADVVTAWSTNVGIERDLGPDVVQMPLWEAGVRMYGLLYYASLSTLQRRTPQLEGFLRATARGWLRASLRREEAMDLVTREYPRLRAPDLRTALDNMLSASLGGLRADAGWGAMEPSFWNEQIALLAATGQLPRTPATTEVMTPDLLEATRQARLRAA